MARAAVDPAGATAVFLLIRRYDFGYDVSAIHADVPAAQTSTVGAVIQNVELGQISTQLSVVQAVSEDKQIRN